MPAAIVSAAYDELERVTTRFDQQSELVSQMRQQIGQQVERLVGKSWIGDSADEFSDEMSSIVVPAVERLAEAFADCGMVTRQLIQIIREAEEEAAGLFSGNPLGAQSGGVGDSSPASQDRAPNKADSIQDSINKRFEEFKQNYPPRSNMVDYFPSGIDGVIAGIFGKKSVRLTESEAKLLDGLGTFEKKAFSDIKDEAFITEAKYTGKDINNDGIGDAFRHAYWSARLAQEFGPEWAKKYTDAHEELRANEVAREFMDRHNNALGIKIATENPNASPEELANKIAEAIKSGEGVHIPGARDFPLDSPQRDDIVENGPLAPTNQNLGPDDNQLAAPPGDPSASG